MNGHWRVVPRHQASRTSSGKATDSPRPRSMTSWPVRSIQLRAQVMAPGQTDARERAAGHGEIAGRLAEAVGTGQRIHIVVERIGAAASGVQEHPEEPAVVAGSPADVVEHDGPGQSLGLEDALHELHGDQVSLVGLGAGDHDVAVAFGPRVRVQESLGEVAGREKVEQPELVLPADAVGLEFGEQVEDRQVTAKLLAGGRGREVQRVFLLPVERDAAVLDEPEGVVDALVADGSWCDR